MDKKIINIYSDETNHLKDPKQGDMMVIGSVWCDKSKVMQISDAIRKVKEYHGLPKSGEVKWTKIATSNQEFYKDLVNLFFNTDDLNFRAVIVPKHKLDHEAHQSTDEEFYYKTQFLMIANIVANHSPNTFRVYIDYKDNWSYYRAKKLEGYLSKKSDFAGCEFTAQPVRSHESELIQLADILIGATSYRSNHYDDANESRPKRAIVDLIEDLAMQRLNQSSPKTSEKVNLFQIWEESRA